MRKVITKIFRRIFRYANEIRDGVLLSLWWLSDQGRNHKLRVASLKNKYAGKRCFVLANGPSLKSTDIRLLKNEVTIGSNALFLYFDEMGYKPTFLTVEDRLVAEDRAVELNAMRGVQKVFPRDLAYCLSDDEDTVFVNFVRHYRGFPRFSDDFAATCYWGGTVSMMNLQLAYFLGCNPIYLIGFDHSYSVPKNLDSHVILSDSDDINHFHPGYFGKGYRWHDPQVDRMETAYREARRFLDSKGVEIFNATAGGKLSVFERVSFDEVMNAER